MTSRAPLRRKLLVLGLALAFWTLAAEGGYRLWRAWKGEPYHAAKARARLDEIEAELTGALLAPGPMKDDLGKVGMAIHPYQGYQITGHTKGAADLARYFASDEARETFDIVLIGGSVAAEFANWAPQYLLPQLQQDPRLAGRKVRLHGIACPGHKQPQHCMTLEWILSLGWKPDAVVLLDGFNELAVGAENAKAGVNPLFPYWIEAQMRLGSALKEPEDLDLLGRAMAARLEAQDLYAELKGSRRMSSAVLGSWSLARLEAAAGRSRARAQALKDHEEGKKGVHSLTVGGPPFENTPDAVREQCAQAWAEGSRSMQAICRASGSCFLHVLQPAAADEGSKPLTAEEAAFAKTPPLWGEATKLGYPRLRELGAELTREGVQFLDASRIFVGHPEPIYRDGCHFEEEGQSILGAFVAEALLRTWKAKD